MGMVTNKTFWFGAVAGVLIWQLVLPRVAPGVKAKIPL